jgi:hypothetical protein
MNTGNYQDQVHDIIGRLVGAIIWARCTIGILTSVAQNTLSLWSDESTFKQKVTSPLKRLLTRFIRKNKDRKPIPSAAISADVARLITSLAVMVNESHAKGTPGKGTDTGASIRAFLQNLDFGEIAEMVEKSDPYVLKALEAFNKELWKYPAKVGALVGTVIALLNIAVKGSREFLLPIERAIAPELMADMSLSLIKDFNGTETAKLINTGCELIRRLHTGSLLLGKGGKPLMQSYLTELLRDCLSGLDPELVRKVLIIFAEDKLSIHNAVSDALTDNPDITLSRLASIGSVKSSDAKALSRRLHVYEEIGQAGLKAAISESISDFDTYEVAGLINIMCRVLNRIHANNPDILNSLAVGVADSLNIEEVGKTVKWLVPDLVQAIKPLAPTIIPVLIRGLSDMINPDGDFANPEQVEALQMLRAAFNRAVGVEK